MSDLNLGNLIELKRHLLGPKLVTNTDFNTVISDLGKGVALAFEGYCNRQFGRSVSGTHECPANVDHVYLPRYPVESISTVELKSDQTTGYETQTNVISNADYKTGLVYFGGALGEWYAHLRITYTGGYWYDTAETEDTTQPTGSTKVPADLKLAWYLQCGHVWANRDKLGIQINTEPNKQSRLGAVELTTAVKEMLNPHRRFALL